MGVRAGWLLGQRRWTKAERDTLSELVCDTAGELLHARDDDEELKALFAKHAEVDFDTERREMMRAIKDLTEVMTGLDLGDDRDRYGRGSARAHAARAAGAGGRGGRTRSPGARRRKSAAQQRREAEAQQATQSVREIYRKLASALHPDRETDARQREGRRR